MVPQVKVLPTAEPEQEETHVDVIPQGEKRKRKDLPHKATSFSPNKKHRGDPGLLTQSKLFDLPMDMLNEIFIRLKPIDLLHLAQTSKAVHATLMNRSSIWLWRKAFSNLSEFLECPFPACPEDLNLAQYTNLVFGKTCQYCLSHEVLFTCWAVRIRACADCIDSRFKIRKPHSIWNTPLNRLRDLVPSVVVTKPGHTPQIYHRHDLYRSWRKELEGAEGGTEDAWVQKKAQEIHALEKPGKACCQWFKDILVLREKVKAALVEQRKARIFDRLRTNGWDDELCRMSTAQFRHRKIESLFELQQACKRDLKESVLLDLDPHLDKCMGDFRQARLKSERETLLRDRLPVLSEILKSYQATLLPNSISPNVGDIFCYPVVSDLVTNTPLGEFTVSAQSQRLLSMLPKITLQWQADMKEKLLSLIRFGCGSDYLFDRGTVLQLATSAFTCSDCSPSLEETLIHYPRVLTHACTTKNLRRVTDSGDFETVRAVTGQAPWNRYGGISFRVDNLRVLSDVVTLCGKNPQTTTFAEMNATNPILECISCNDQSTGRAMMRWSVVPAHVRSSHRLHARRPLKLELLNDADAQIVRDEIDSDGQDARDEIVRLILAREPDAVETSKRAWPSRVVGSRKRKRVL